MKYADYGADIALLAKTPDHAESLLHCLEQTAGRGISLHTNANKTDYMCFKPGASKICRRVYIRQLQYLIYIKWF